MGEGLKNTSNSIVAMSLGNYVFFSKSEIKDSSKSPPAQTNELSNVSYSFYLTNLNA